MLAEAAKIDVRSKWKISAFAYFYQKKKRAWDILHEKKWRRVMFLPRCIDPIEILSKLRIVYSTRNGKGP